jgi:hypothetical protein
MRWIKHAFKYGLRNAIYYWREERKPENAPKVLEASNQDSNQEGAK